MMYSGRTALAALAAAAGLLFGAGVAQAGDSGSFRLVASLVHDNTTIGHAEGRVTGGTATGTVTVLQSSGGPFDEGSHAVAACVTYARTSEAGVGLEAPCTMTHASGDRLFLVARRSAGDLREGGGGAGRWELTGGTGRYAGIGGSCSYETEYLPGNHLVSDAACAWQRQ